MPDLNSLNAKQQEQLQELIKAINGANAAAKIQQQKQQNSGINFGSQPNNTFDDVKYQNDIKNIRNIINQANADAATAASGFPTGTQSTSQTMSDFERQVMENYSKKNEINLETQRQQKIKREIAQMRFMTTKQLYKAKLEPESLDKYIERYLYKNGTQCNFDYTIRDTHSNNGLHMMCYLYGNIAWIENNSEKNGYDSISCNNIYNVVIDSLSANIERKTSRKSKSSAVALGLLNCYKSGELDYDEVPSDEMINNFIEKYNESDNRFTQQNIDNKSSDNYNEESFNNYNNFDDSFNSDASKYYNSINNPASYMEDNFPSQPSFTYDNKGEVIIEPRQVQNVMLLNTESYSNIDNPKYHTIERFKKKLFESRNGTAYEFKKRWDLVLKAIHRLFPNASMVTRLSIMGTQITVNGKLILIDDILGGDYDIRLEDIVCIRSTFKKFPFIQYLILDNLATQKLILEYGDNAMGIWRIFKENKPLKTIGLIPSCNGQPVNYNREDFAQKPEQIASALDKQLSHEKFNMQMEQAFAFKNPRLHEKSPGYINNVWNTGKKFGGKAWERASKNFMDDKNPKLLRFMGWSVAAVACIGIGGILGIPGAIKNTFRKI